jgi:hypothetical protein
MKTVINKDVTLNGNARINRPVSVMLPNGLPKGMYHLILEVRDSGGNVVATDDDIYNKFVVGGEAASLQAIHDESLNAAWVSEK